VRDLIFCGTLTTKMLDETISATGIAIQNEGHIKRFVERVNQVTFNAPLALASGKRVTIITDRGIFAVTSEGLMLTDIMPGIDIGRDIVAQIPFKIQISPNLNVVPPHLLLPELVKGDAAARITSTVLPATP